MTSTVTTFTQTKGWHTLLENETKWTSPKTLVDGVEFSTLFMIFEKVVGYAPSTPLLRLFSQWLAIGSDDHRRVERYYPSAAASIAQLTNRASARDAAVITVIAAVVVAVVVDVVVIVVVVVVVVVGLLLLLLLLLSLVVVVVVVVVVVISENKYHQWPPERRTNLPPPPTVRPHPAPPPIPDLPGALAEKHAGKFLFFQLLRKRPEERALGDILMTEDQQGGSEQAGRGGRVRMEGVSMEPPGFLKRLFSVPKNVRKTAAAGDVVVPVIGARDGWGGIRQARTKCFVFWDVSIPTFCFQCYSVWMPCFFRCFGVWLFCCPAGFRCFHCALARR